MSDKLLETSCQYLASLNHLERNVVGLNVLVGNNKELEMMLILTPEHAASMAEGILISLRRLKERQQ